MKMMQHKQQMSQQHIQHPKCICKRFYSKEFQLGKLLA